MNAIDLFRAAMRAHGLNPLEIIEPGKLHRFGSNGKRHDDAGWCKLFPDCGGGVFGDFRSGLSDAWQAQREKPFTAAEREAFRQRCEAERRAREAEEARRHAEAREKAAEIWKAATPTSASHPYLARKQVGSVESLRDIDAAEAAEILGYAPKCRGEPLTGRLLLVPIKMAGGNGRLVKWLGAMEERPWPEYSRGKPITARQVAAALRRFEIKPALVRAGAEVARGYAKDDFADAFARYLPPKDPPSDPLHRYNLDGARVSEDLDPLHGGDGVTDRKPPEAKQDAGCNGVTDRKGGPMAGDPPPWETRL
jgi:hypothetical protein